MNPCDEDSGVSSGSGAGRHMITILGFRNADGHSLPPSTNQRQKVSIQSPSDDSDGFVEHDLPTSSKRESALFEVVAPPRRPVRVHVDRANAVDDPSGSGDETYVSRLSMSAVPTRIGVPLQLATWSARHMGSPKMATVGGQTSYFRTAPGGQGLLAQRSRTTGGSLAARQLSGSPMSLPTGEERVASSSRYYSPFAVDGEVDSQAQTTETTSDVDRPTSRRTAFARRMNQLADAHVSVYSGCDLASRTDKDPSGTHTDTTATDDASRMPSHSEFSELTVDDAPALSLVADRTAAKPVNTRASLANAQTVSLGGVVLNATPPPNLPAEPVAAPRTGPDLDAAVATIHLSESVAELPTSFMSLSTVLEPIRASTYSRPVHELAQSNPTVSLNQVPVFESYVPTSVAGPLVDRAHSHPLYDSSSRPTTYSASSKVPSTSSTDASFGPPNTDRRDTMPLHGEPFLQVIGPHASRPMSSTPSSDSAAKQHEEALSRPTTAGVLFAVEPSGSPVTAAAYLRRARELREIERGASLRNHTIRSLEDEEVELVRQSCASRMAHAERQSALDVKAMRTALPGPVTLPAQSTADGVPDEIKKRVYLLDAQNRVNAEIKRQLRVQKQLDGQNGLVRYFPDV